MGSLCIRMRREPFLLAEGLGELFSPGGELPVSSDAAAVVLAETILYARAWFKAQFKGQ